MSEDVVEVMARAMCKPTGHRIDPPAHYMRFLAQAALSALTEGGWEVRKVQDSSRDHAPTTCAATPKSAAPEWGENARRIIDGLNDAIMGRVTQAVPTRTPLAERESSREDQKPNVPNTIREGE